MRQEKGHAQKVTQGLLRIEPIHPRILAINMGLPAGRGLALAGGKVP